MEKFFADSKMFEFDRYFRECKKNNQPFIKAHKNQIDKNYLVQLDLSSCDYDLDTNACENIKEFFKKETKSLELYENKQNVYKGSNVDKELAWYDGILPERLNVFCESLFDMAQKSD